VSKEPPELKVVPLAGVPDATVEAVRKLEKEMKNMPKLLDLLGQVTWLRYQAYKRAGFTDAQALQLCCQTSH
jgi:hypothetical protein